MFNRINAVVLFVHNFEKSLQFYRDQLGLEVAFQEPSNVGFRMHDQDFVITSLDEGIQMTGIAEQAFDPQTGRSARMMLCTRVQDVDAAYKAFTEKGVEFTKPPTDLPWGLRAAYFRDPEGNIWEIAHPITV